MNEVIGALGPQYLDAASVTQTVSEGLLIPERAGAVWGTFKDEISENSPKEKATASMVLGAFALEQGPINETISALITTGLLGSGASPAVAGIFGGISYALQQCGYGLVTAKGVTAIPKTEQAYHEQFPTKQNTKKTTSLLGKTGILLVWGTSALVLNEHTQVENQTMKKDVKLLRNWMPFLIAVDLAVFTGASYGIENSDSVGVDSGSTIEILTNPMTFIAAFGLFKYIQHYRKYQKNLKDEPEPKYEPEHAQVTKKQKLQKKLSSPFIRKNQATKVEETTEAPI